MDEPPVLGYRTVKRAFDEDRHSVGLIAKILDRIVDASEDNSTPIDSVHDDRNRISTQPRLQDATV